MRALMSAVVAKTLVHRYPHPRPVRGTHPHGGRNFRHEFFRGIYRLFLRCACKISCPAAMTASNAAASGVIIHHRRYPVCGQLLSAHPAFRSFHCHYASWVSSSGSYSPQISSSSSTSVRYRKLREFQQQPSSWSLQLQSRHILYMFQFLSFFLFGISFCLVN